MRLGPSAYYVDALDYTFGPSNKDEFYLPARNFIPSLSADDLYPDTSGIRPKLQGPGEPFRDFVITNEARLGLPNFINLIGIESPGLTSCLSIAEYVEKIIL
jgi:L-2-hydroxyglutarate oxidase LhgO